AAHVDARPMVGHVVEDRGGIVEAFAVLIEIGDPGIFAEHDLARPGRDLTEDGAQQGGLARTAPADDAEPLARREDEVEILDERAIAREKRELAELQDGLSDARGVDGELRRAFLPGRRRGLPGLGALDAGLLLAGAGLGLTAQPLELSAEEVLSVGFG